MNKNAEFGFFFGLSALFFAGYVAWDSQELRVYQNLKTMISIHFVVLVGVQFWNYWITKKQSEVMKIKQNMEVWWMTIALALFWWILVWFIQIKFTQ